MTPELEILAIAVVTAVAAALPGTYLVLRRTAMVSDAISHAILPGIVVAFFLTRDLNSPLLLLAAALTGVLTVVLIEALIRTRLVPEDASIGIVFPALFSIGVILISRGASDVHLDTDAVLLGELAFAPFHRLTVGGADLGPAALWSMGAILVVNAVLILLAWKELKAVHCNGRAVLLEPGEESERATAAMDAKYRTSRSEQKALPAATRKHYAGFVWVRIDTEGEPLSWDNAKIRMKADG